MTDRSRTTIKLALAFTVYIMTALYIDIGTTSTMQLVISLTTWLFLAGAIRHSPREERIQVFVMIGVATIFECFCSLIWGVYVYRLDNLPLYVPPGHGLFYLMAIRLAELPIVIRFSKGIVAWVMMGGMIHLTYNQFAEPNHDVLGVVSWLIFLPFILRSRFAYLYAVSFTMTMGLEFYGTNLGNWAWMPVVPVIGLSAASPPAFVGVGYCIMDGITRVLSPSVQRLLERRFRLSRAAEMVADER